MKSTGRPPKPQQPKPNNLGSKPKQILAINQSEGQSLNITDEPVELIQDVPSAIANDDSPRPHSAQHSQKPRGGNSKSSESFQHMQFLDCNSEVGRVIFECYHCHQGIISEYTGEPVMGEYKGRHSVIFTKVKCPNCEQTAIRLQAREVLSTTAIPSPWAEK